MSDDKIKEAFAKAKQDMFSLASQISLLREELGELKKKINVLFLSSSITLPLSYNIEKADNPAYNQTDNKTVSDIKPAIQQTIPTDNTSTSNNPTDNLPLKSLKTQKTNISTGNEGVPTNRQTNQQTDNSTGNEGVKVRLIQEKQPSVNKETHSIQLQKVNDVINSLDDIKRDLRKKFRKATKQEMAVFATIYQLEEEGFEVSYALIAKRLNLSESSIRDYIQRIIRKDIPILKIKENNKKVLLSISPDLKKVTSLDALIRLREL